MNWKRLEKNKEYPTIPGVIIDSHRKRSRDANVCGPTRPYETSNGTIREVSRKFL